MQVVLYFFGAILAIGMLSYLIKCLVGHSVLRRNPVGLGVVMLKRGLVERGVDISQIPDSAFIELSEHIADTTKSLCQIMKKPKAMLFTEQLESYIIFIEGAINGSRFRDPEVSEVLVRHGVKIPKPI